MLLQRINGHFHVENTSRAGAPSVDEPLTLIQCAGDGIVGMNTLRELNVTVAERISQIILNMERWRWMPRVMESDYLIEALRSRTGRSCRVLDSHCVT